MKRREKKREGGDEERERTGRLIEVFSHLKHSSNHCHANQHNSKINPKMIYIYIYTHVPNHFHQTSANNKHGQKSHSLFAWTHTHRHTPTSPVSESGTISRMSCHLGIPNPYSTGSHQPTARLLYWTS